MIKMSLGMKNELPKRILIIHVARVSHQVFARVGSRVLSRLEFQDYKSHKLKVLTPIKNRYRKVQVASSNMSRAGIYRLLMERIFDAYVLRPIDKI